MLQDAHSSGGFLIHAGTSNSQQNIHSSGGFLIQELVIPSRITIPPVDSSFRSW
jgi:hypothetical protein